MGGHVRKGEESTIMAFWKVEDLKPSNDGVDIEENNEKTRRRFDNHLQESADLKKTGLVFVPRLVGTEA